MPKRKTMEETPKTEQDTGIVELDFPKPPPPAVLPEEFREYAKPEDAMWSPLKQLKIAAERRVAADIKRKEENDKLKAEGKPYEEVPLWKPPIILNAKDLLILREKRKHVEQQGLQIPFSVGAKSAKPGDSYERLLAEAIAFVDSCLFTHDREGNPLGGYTQASRLKSIGVELPLRLANYEYLPGVVDFPSYWPDFASYAYLWKQKRPERDTE